MARSEERIAQEALEYALADGIFTVHKALLQNVSALMTELDLTESLADALWQLDPEGAPLSRRALSERLHCDPSNVTFLVDRLDEKGLVERVVDASDRRVKATRLTPAGASTRERLVRGTASGPTFASLGLKEKQQLAHLLSKTQPSYEHSRSQKTPAIWKTAEVLERLLK
jgi:DNA-binding MarR family transcriptional regulator